MPAFINFTVSSGTIPTTMQSSVTYDGVTFTFDRAMPVAYFPGPTQGSETTGEPFVVSDQAFAITSITPASSDLESDGYVGHGAMLNPAIGNGALEQGFDGYLGDYPPSTVKQTPYNASLNIDPAISGNVAISQGQKASIVKSVRNPSATSTGAVFQQIDRYVTLTVLDAAPPVGTVRPGISGTTKTLRGRSDVSYTPRNIAKPASWPTIETIMANVGENHVAFHAKGENRRLLRVEPQGPTGYTGEFVQEHAYLVSLLNISGLSASQRQQIEDRVLVIANDIEALQSTGLTLASGAGQGGADWCYAVAAAIITNDASFLSAVRGYNLQPDGKSQWITSDLVGIAAPGKNDTSAQTYFTEMVGLPDVIPEYVGSNYHERYVDIGGWITSWEVLSILAFADGPGAFNSGEDCLLNGGALDSTNTYASGLAYAAIARTFTPQDWAPGSYQYGASYNDFWDDLVADGAMTPFTGQPSHPPRAEYFSAAAGGFTFNMPSGFDYATEGSRTFNARYSMDRVQFVEVTGITDAQTVTGLIRGQEHLIQLQHETASGKSAWNFYGSTSWPVTDDTDWVGLITPTGTETNAQADYTGGVAPEIHARLHPAYDLKQWTPVTGTLDADDVELAAGAGYPSACYPAPTIAYEWQESDTGGGAGFTAISGATGQIFNRGAAQAQKYLRCKLTVTNSEGSTVVYTNEVQAPALVSLPAGTLIDTDFRGRFAVDYENELNDMIANAENCTPGHLPSFTSPVIETEFNFGAFILDKANGQTNPRTNFDLSKANVEAGESYRITGQLISDSSSSLSGNVEIALRRQSDLTDYDTRYSTAVGPYAVIDFDFTVAIPGGESNLAANVFFGMVGGASSGWGDDPFITALKIEKV